MGKFHDQYRIFECIAGSHSYGTNIDIPGVYCSDFDTRGVFVAPPSHVLSCIQSVEQEEDTKQDFVSYELKKFMNLAAQSNPNIIELLYTDDANILFMDWPFEEIRKNWHLFLSKKAKHTFSGYACSQLHRIKGHKKWIMRPQEVEPPSLSSFCKFVGLDGKVQKDAGFIQQLQQTCFLAETFGMTQFRVYRSPEFFKEKLGFFTNNNTQVKYTNIHDDVLEKRAEFVGFLWINLDEFKKQHLEWKQYWEWKNNRNVVRAQLEEQHGYDCKHALHLVRLMTMAQEILERGEVIVRRPDAEHLLKIRNGEFDYDWLLNWADEMDDKLDKLYETSSLQFSADYEAIDELYRNIVIQYWQEKGLIKLSSN